MEQVGPDRDHPTTAQHDWPKGIVTLTRHPSRVYSIWVNGREDFCFEADLSGVNELLDLFSKARLRDHEVWIRSGKPVTGSLRSSTNGAISHNVHLEILGGLAVTGLESSRRPEPHLTVYVDDKTPADQLVLPSNLILHCDIQGKTLESKASKPARRPWYGRVQFETDGGGVDLAHDKLLEHGIRTWINLWETGCEDEIRLAEVDRGGLFCARLSEAEMADLKGDKSKLTITVGNAWTESNKSDPTFPVGRLGDLATAGMVRIPAPRFFHGRLLFEDGGAAKLSPPPWPGAKITIVFPYTHPAEPDNEGYFKMFFTHEQYEALMSEKPRKNIYVPDGLQGRTTSTARFAFPASLLSQDKAQAGAVRIPRP